MIIVNIVFLSSAVIAAAIDSLIVQSDADLRQKIVGAWIQEVGRTNWNSWSRGTVIYSSDGSFADEGRQMAGGKEKINKSGGYWQVNNGVLMLTATNNTVSGYGLSVIVRQGTNYSVKQSSGYTNFDLLQPGTFGTNHHKLIRIDEHEMVYHLFGEAMSVSNLPGVGNIADVITNKRLASVVGATQSKEESTGDWFPDTELLDLAARRHDPFTGDAGSTLARDVKRYYELLRDRKWHQTYELRAKAFREGMLETDYLAEAIQYGDKWGLVDYQVLSVGFEKLYGSTNTDQATLICKFTELPDHAVSYSTVYWHREEGVWKCLSAGPSKLSIFTGIRLPVVDWR
jgi:hypothetical protein